MLFSCPNEKSWCLDRYKHSTAPQPLGTTIIVRLVFPYVYVQNDLVDTFVNSSADRRAVTVAAILVKRNFFCFLPAAKPSRSSKGELSFFLLSSIKVVQKGPKQSKQHGSICSLGHKFQIWGQIWPPRLFGGHNGLKTSLLRTSL